MQVSATCCSAGRIPAGLSLVRQDPTCKGSDSRLCSCLEACSSAVHSQTCQQPPSHGSHLQALLPIKIGCGRHAF